MDYKKYIAERLPVEGMTAEEVASLIACPPDPSMGDYALPCFKLAKVLRKSPAAIAEALCAAFPVGGVVSKAEAVNGYLNFTVDRAAMVRDILSEALSKGDRYGASDAGMGRVVCIDYSSVNIAKRFHIGHLSTTVLGAAIYRILNFLGYKSVGINHLGD